VTEVRKTIVKFIGTKKPANKIKLRDNLWLRKHLVKLMMKAETKGWLEILESYGKLPSGIH